MFGPRVQPRIAAVEHFDTERAFAQIDIVHIRDLEFATAGRPDVTRDIEYPVVVEI